jgi:glycosyltransferase involved in cell wall biosynthesis
MGKTTTIYPFQLPTVATFYDFIPLMRPNEYVEKLSFERDRYFRQIERLRELSCIFPISASSARELEMYGNCEEVPMLIIKPGTSKFGNGNVVSKNANLSSRQGTISKPFALAVGSHEPRKNIGRLVTAFLRADRMCPLGCKLILIGRYAVSFKLVCWLKALAAGFNTNRIEFAGQISDKQLLDYYRHSRLVVVPSIHEGFGLPVIEAQSNGAIVIGSNTSSIPEALNNESAEFDPESVADMGNLIDLGLHSDSFRNQIRKNEKVNPLAHNWDTRDAYKVLRGLVSTEPTRNSNEEEHDLNSFISEFVSLPRHKKVQVALANGNIFDAISVWKMTEW